MVEKTLQITFFKEYRSISSFFIHSETESDKKDRKTEADRDGDG